jgi:glycosyltransferase involved in cell wall biosynthesis
MRGFVAGILIDISRLLHRGLARRLSTGVDRVSLEYLRRYIGHARAVLTLQGLHVVLSHIATEQIFRRLVEKETHPAADWAAIACLLAMASANMGYARDIDAASLFNTGHMGITYRRCARALRKRGARQVFMIHDLIPITHPEYCRQGELERHRRRMQNALRLGHGIVTNSQDTLASLDAFSRNWALPIPPAIVAPLAPGLPQSLPGRRPIAQPYFVALSTIEPRKNHLLLLHVWRRLIERMGEQAPRLIIIGHRGWECENVVDLLERS